MTEESGLDIIVQHARHALYSTVSGSWDVTLLLHHAVPVCMPILWFCHPGGVPGGAHGQHARPHDAVLRAERVLGNHDGPLERGVSRRHCHHAARQHRRSRMHGGWVALKDNHSQAVHSAYDAQVFTCICTAFFQGQVHKH